MASSVASLYMGVELSLVCHFLKLHFNRFYFSLYLLELCSSKSRVSGNLQLRLSFLSPDDAPQTGTSGKPRHFSALFTIIT